MTDFIAPRYEVPLVNQETGRISLEWYKFLVPLAKKAVSTGTSISTTAPISGGGDLTGDLTFSIDQNGITNALLAQMAAHTFKGNATGGAADPQDMNGTQATALLDAFTATLKGLAPASGGGTADVLLADGTWGHSVSGSFAAGTYLKTATTVVGSLPAAATAGAGARHMVTDANSTTFNSIVATGGANVVPVFSDGTNWRIG